MFRYKKSVPVSYERQGYIYFSSLLYREMPEKAQRKILNLCMECGGGDYYRALFEFVTTDANATYICDDSGRRNIQTGGGHGTGNIIQQPRTIPRLNVNDTMRARRIIVKYHPGTHRNAGLQ